MQCLPIVMGSSKLTSDVDEPYRCLTLLAACFVPIKPFWQHALCLSNSSVLCPKSSAPTVPRVLLLYLSAIRHCACKPVEQVGSVDFSSLTFPNQSILHVWQAVQRCHIDAMPQRLS